MLLSGCFVRSGRGVQVSSLKSDYSPVVAFVAKVRLTDSVHVQVDRVRVLSPGEVFPGMGPVTGPIEMQALVVTANPAGDMNKPSANSDGSRDRNGSRKPWREHAGSSQVRLADSLMMGVAHTTGPMHFTMPLPPATDLPASWLVFRITGSSVAMPARMADGSMAPIMAMPPIRVFACSIRNLDGKIDAARKRQMDEAYSAGC